MARVRYVKFLKDIHCCRFLGGYDPNKTSTIVPLETFFGPGSKKMNVLKKIITKLQQCKCKNVHSLCVSKKTAGKNIPKKLFLKDDFFLSTMWKAHLKIYLSHNVSLCIDKVMPQWGGSFFKTFFWWYFIAPWRNPGYADFSFKVQSYVLFTFLSAN